MVIGIIGASLAGLVAGKKLAQAGHEVTVIEKGRGIGGRVSSVTGGPEHNFIFDHGHSFFTSETSEFKQFTDSLKEEGIIHDWAEKFGYFDGTQFHGMNPNRMSKNYMCAGDGMVAVAEYLARWVDLKMNEQAGGLTHIGSDRSRKRAWMINLTDISVFECDAVIIAAPAPQAYGILKTTQDETPVRRIIRHIDEIRYEPVFSLITYYEKMDIPDWNGIECEDPMVDLIINESSKRDMDGAAALVIRSTPSYAREISREDDADPNRITGELLERAASIVDMNLMAPTWNQLHFWKYGRAVNPSKESFMELEMENTPLALVGDYFGGNRLEDAFLSGHRLAEYWIGKYETVSINR